MSSRARSKPLAALATVLVVGVVAMCFVIGKAHERQEFVSKAFGGYRYRCTLSADWKPTQRRLSPVALEQEHFTTSQSPIREWIALHLFPQPSSTGNMTVPRPYLYLSTTMTKDTARFLQIREGYPHEMMQPPDHIVEERRLRIDGCPATIVRFEIPSGLTQIVRGTSLCVCTPDFSYAYTAAVHITSDKTDLRYHDQLDLEMQAIIASFHLEKVVPTGGKR